MGSKAIPVELEGFRIGAAGNLEGARSLVGLPVNRKVSFETVTLSVTRPQGFFTSVLLSEIVSPTAYENSIRLALPLTIAVFFIFYLKYSVTCNPLRRQHFTLSFLLLSARVMNFSVSSTPINPTKPETPTRRFILLFSLSTP